MNPRLRILVGVGMVTVGGLLASCGATMFTGISNDRPDDWPELAPSPDPEGAMIGTYRYVGDYTYNPIGTNEFPSAQLASILVGLPARDPRPLGMFVKISRVKPGQLLVEVITGTGGGLRVAC